MTRLTLCIALASLMLVPQPAGADDSRGGRGAKQGRVVATLPTVGALVREIAGEEIAVQDLARGDEDPHFVQPTPLLMRRARAADMMFELGMRLELWADNVATGSGNPKIQRGTRGRVVLSEGVPPLEVPTRIDAAKGDIHPQGNPHIWLDPVRAKMMARTIEAALSYQFPVHAETFRARLADFEKRIDHALYGEELVALVGSDRLDRAVLTGKLHALLDKPFKGEPLRTRAGGWLARAAPLRGKKVVEYHKVWVYAAGTFGFEIVGVIEEFPGVRPGPGHVNATIELMKREGVELILVDNYYGLDLPRHVAEKAGARVEVLPNQVGGEKGIVTYFDLIDDVLQHLVGPEESR